MKFRAGDKSLEDDEHNGRPSDVENNQLRALVEDNKYTTVRELASELDITYTTISNHLREIGKTKNLFLKKNLKRKKIKGQKPQELS